MNIFKYLQLALTTLFVAALPASGSYQLNSYGFGTGGTANSTSANYGINGIAGDTAGRGSSSNYIIGAGETYSKESDVPLVTLSNPAAFYNKLNLVLDNQNNPSDAKFSIAISSDNFTTTKYVKNDFTITSTQSFSNYLTYAGWGGSSGIVVRGLAPSTIYTAKATAYRGKFTESGYGPATSATTAAPSVAFKIDVSAIDTTTSPPYLVSMGSLLADTVINSPVKVWVSIDTNGESGGKVYINGLNTGLKSLLGAYTIPSSTGDLGALTEGFGAQSSTNTQSSGGPLTVTSPYGGTSGNVGITDTIIREIYNTSTPLTAGRASFILEAKSKSLTPAASDYAETLTCIESIAF
jgi:hypothetical protein